MGSLMFLCVIRNLIFMPETSCRFDMIKIIIFEGVV